MLRLGRWKWAFAGGIGFILAILILAAVAVPYSSDKLRQVVVSALAQRLDSEVELDRFDARVYPALHIDGGGLVVRHHGRRDVPPLITVKSFSVDAGLFPLLRKHLTSVKLVGLDIRIPPDSHDGDDAGAPEAESSSGGAGTPAGRDIIVDHLEATDGSFVVLPDKPDVAPKVWSIHDLSMRNVGTATKMPFEATLTNAVPPGEIAMTGAFGPWNADLPGVTPLEGRFRFDDANLAVFKGVYGTLSARGTFGGDVAHIDVHGETNTPDFGITTALHSVPLHATYHSVVDGTNGNTLLKRIDADFLGTSLTAAGAIVNVPGREGRNVDLDLTIPKGRLEDVLLLAVKSPKPPMTGGLRLTTKFLLPPGDIDVIERLQLNGRFAISGARFTSLDIQKRIDELSHRSRGRIHDVPARRVLSDFDGDFRLRAASLALPHVAFAVPGATVRLAGDYRLRSGQLDFHGTLLMAARVSDTVGGFKHVLLKLVDPLFNRDGGGSAIPIKITGTRSDPDFGLDKSRLFKR